MKKILKYLTVFTMLLSLFIVAFCYLRYLMYAYRHEHYDVWTKKERQDYDSIFSNNLGFNFSDCFSYEIGYDIEHWSYYTGAFVNNAITNYPGWVAIGIGVLFFIYCMIRKIKPHYSKLTCFTLTIFSPAVIYLCYVIFAIMIGLIFLAELCKNTTIVVGVRR
jgi:hypothetical protein